MARCDAKKKVAVRSEGRRSVGRKHAVIQHGVQRRLDGPAINVLLCRGCAMDEADGRPSSARSFHHDGLGKVLGVSDACPVQVEHDRRAVVNERRASDGTLGLRAGALGGVERGWSDGAPGRAPSLAGRECNVVQY